MIEQALTVDEKEAPWLHGITREQLEQEGSIRLKFPQEGSGGAFQPFTSEEWFRTPSGKAEFYSEALAAQGLDPLPQYVPPIESRHAELADRFPLELLGRKADNFMNSTFASQAGHRAMEAKHSGRLEMHPADAQARNIADGDPVEIFNDRGKILLLAKVNGAVPAGVVASRLGWNKLSCDGQGTNALTSETLTDLGGGPTFYSTLVEVCRAATENVKGEQE